jgi:toxin ParE1/3/4
LKEIKNYIARSNIAAARSFVEGFWEQCRILAMFPGMCRSYSQLAPSLRMFTIGNYIIFYRPIEKGIEVERLLSGYRDLDALFPEVDNPSEL